MSGSIDFVLPTTGNHGWVVSEGWIKSADEAQLLGRVFRPQAKWGASEPEMDDGLLQQLTDNSLSETVVVLGMDWHSQPLTRSEKWRSAWKNCQSRIVAVIWEDYTSEFVARQEQLFQEMVEAARRAIECVDWIYSNHEENVYFFQNTFDCHKIGYLPFSADLGIFRDNPPDARIYDKLCFKGFIKDFGFTSGPYLQRARLARALSEKLGDRFVFDKDNVSDNEYARVISKYFFQINLPSFSPSMTARAAEVMAAGNFLFQFIPSGKITNEHFKDGRDMVFYDPDDFDELVQKIEFYLSNLEDAKKIARDGHKRFVANFSMSVQLRHMASPWKRLGCEELPHSKALSPRIRKILDQVDLDQVLLPARLEFASGLRRNSNLPADLFKQLLHMLDMASEPQECDFLAIKSLNRSDYDRFLEDVLGCLPDTSRAIFEDISFRLQPSVNPKALRIFLELRPIYRIIAAESEVERACLYIRFCMYYYTYTCMLPIHYRVLICFADMQPVENLIAQIARATGLLTVTLQHGLYVDYGDIDTVNRVNYEHQPSEYFLAWGGLTANLIRRHHPGNSVIAVGKPEIYATSANNEVKEGSQYVSIIMDQHWYDDENVEMLKVVSEYCRSCDLAINVKFHPTNKREKYTRANASYRSDLDVSGSLFIVGHTSSLAYEFLVLGRRVFFFKSNTPRLPTDDRVTFCSSDQLAKIASEDYPKQLGADYIKCTGEASRDQYRKFFASLRDRFEASA
jgi:hypothetical protein